MYGKEKSTLFLVQMEKNVECCSLVTWVMKKQKAKHVFRYKFEGKVEIGLPIGMKWATTSQNPYPFNIGTSRISQHWPMKGKRWRSQRNGSIACAGTKEQDGIHIWEPMVGILVGLSDSKKHNKILFLIYNLYLFFWYLLCSPDRGKHKTQTKNQNVHPSNPLTKRPRLHNFVPQQKKPSFQEEPLCFEQRYGISGCSLSRWDFGNHSRKYERTPQ